jgi:hypothetical protein
MAEINLPEKMDRIDAIRAHLVDGAEISATQQEMLRRYKAAFLWMSERSSPGQAIEEVQTTFELSYQQASKIVRDAIQLYGDVHAYSKQGLKQIMYEKLLRLADRSEDAGDFRAAEKLLDKACKVMDLYNAKEAKGGGTTNIFIGFTDDPAVLEAQNTEDIEHEEQ